MTNDVFLKEGIRMKYSEAAWARCRRKTREVMVGDVGVGASNPIRVQSMTITDTMDTEATVRQTIELCEAGCDIVRITAPSIREAENLKNIKAALRAANINVPLVADIHFTPNAALKAVEYVEKVRINPGNYADRKKFEVREYSDNEYDLELERLHEVFKPLVVKAKEYGVAMRVGTNHGSLSDRILNRFGDTPLGMVESALEFVRICEIYNYRELVLSMKSSNPQVMIQAYRLLAARMYELGMDYPFHLGVTEAGDGEDGRVKSAVGIGALLEDGIGDTIRVSLTEDPVAEVPAGRKIAQKYEQGTNGSGNLRDPFKGSLHEKRNPYEYERRWSKTVEIPDYSVGGVHAVRVEIKSGFNVGQTEKIIDEVRRLVLEKDTPCEFYQVDVGGGEVESLKRIADHLSGWPNRPALSVRLNDHRLVAAVLPCADKLCISLDGDNEPAVEAVVVAAGGFEKKAVEFEIEGEEPAGIGTALKTAASVCKRTGFDNVLFSVKSEDLVRAYRVAAAVLSEPDMNFPLSLHYRPRDYDPLSESSAVLGALLCDGIGDLVQIDAPMPADARLQLSYTLLQAARLRISRTEFISCPSCGRTLFDLQETTARIKKRTAHLKGVKIAIMGCIVNGPGEMADADFGYVGSGVGKISLYVGKDCVKKNIPTAMADDELVSLIKEHNRWVDPKAVS